MMDWVGLPIEYTDAYGQKHPVYLLVVDLPASSYIYTEPFRDMKLSSWIDGHVHTFDRYGGVPRMVVTDNTKTAVTKVNCYDPKLNRMVFLPEIATVFMLGKDDMRVPQKIRNLSF